MSGNYEMVSIVNDEESMIKYLREKIIGRPAVFSRAGDIPIDDNMPPIKRTNSQNSLNDITSNDTTTQVEKLIAAGGGTTSGRRPISSSSPIIIPKKPPRSNASSQSSSSYTSVADQLSSFGESDDASNSTFPTLPSTCQQLEHSAARDRISVKNKRRQPIKQKLSTLRETDDNEVDLFSSKTEAISSTPEEEQSITVTTNVEPKVQQPLMGLSDLDTARTRLRIRPRDRSADNILLSTNTNSEMSSMPPPIIPKFNSSIQRSVSFKRPQEINKTELFQQSILKTKKEENNENTLINTENELISNDLSSHNDNNISPTQSMSSSSSQEHIYDNLDVFKRSKPSNEDEPVKTREHPLPVTRLRPVTMHVTANNDKQTTANEFENVFNQLKKRSSIRRVQPITPEPPPVEETPTPPPSQPENEPTIAINKPIETTLTPQTPNRRKTVGGVHLPANNKVATDDNKPTPSWVDIAKQKQNKFQSISNEKSHKDESEQQISTEPSVPIRKQVPSVDIRSNRKSMFEQSTTQTNAHAIERDSIRALKAGNPNRINNLIQFFDK